MDGICRRRGYIRGIFEEIFSDTNDVKKDLRVLAGNETFWEAVVRNISSDAEVEFISELEKLEEIIVVAKEGPWRAYREAFVGFGKGGSVSAERRREAEFWLEGVRWALRLGEGK